MKIAECNPLCLRRWAMAVGFALLMSAANVCARTVAYIANADSREIYVLELPASDGAATLVETVPVAGMVMPLAVSPDCRNLYAALRSAPYAAVHFAIDPASGRLTPLETVPLADNMAYLSTDRTGRYLFAASYFGNKISVNPLGSKGEIEPTALAVLATGKNAHCIAVDPSNKFLFVTNLGDDAILQYRFDAKNGAIMPNVPPAIQTQKGAGPRHLVFHRNGRFVYGSNELNGSVSAYALSASGTLSWLQSESVVPAGFRGAAFAAADLHLTPDGRFLYVSERASSTIAAFRVDGESGKLAWLGNYPTETQPRGFGIDPAGKYLLAVGQQSNGLSCYAVDQQAGTLRHLSHLEVGKNPNWVEIIALPK